MNTKKKIGILGGMGPAATVELFSRIVQNTPAKSDYDHANIIILNDPQIPDRTKYILGKGVSPVPRLVKNINKLYHAGAEVIAIPCMTAHSFINDLQRSTPIPIINAIELINNYVETYHLKDINNIGLLATQGSVFTGVFQNYITKNICIPGRKAQDSLMNIIYGKNGIKAGNTSDNVKALQEIVNELKQSQEIQAVIAGCTELGLVMNDKNMGLPVIDPINLLALEAVKLGSNFGTLIENK